MSSLLPPPFQHLQRYSTPASESSLSERFGLNWDAQMQDWDLNNANAERLPVLLVALGESHLADDERYALTALAIASVDEAIQLDLGPQDHWETLEALLRRRPGLIAPLIFYWAEPALRGVDVEEQYSISGRMARLWNQILPELPPNPGS